MDWEKYIEYIEELDLSLEEKEKLIKQTYAITFQLIESLFEDN